MNPTVVILLSDKRSGSTMFEREMCRQPEVQCVRYTPHTFNETHHWLKGARLLGLPPAAYNGGKVYDGYGSVANARTYLLDCIKGNVSGYQDPRDDRELVFGGWEAMCREYSKPVFFEKSPQHLPHWAALSLILEWARETEFEVKFVALVRNPLSVLYSAQKLFHTDPASRQFAWFRTHQNLLAFQALVDHGQFMMVRYEDLIRDAESGFAEVCRFVGLERHEEVGRDVHDKSANKWKGDPGFVTQLDPVVTQLAGHFGYTAEDLLNPVSEGTVQRNGPSLMDRLKLAGNRVRHRYVKPIWMRIRNAGKA